MAMLFIVLCAHVHTVIPDKAFLRKGRPVAIRYMFCHLQFLDCLFVDGLVEAIRRLTPPAQAEAFASCLSNTCSAKPTPASA